MSKNPLSTGHVVGLSLIAAGLLFILMLAPAVHPSSMEGSSMSPGIVSIISGIAFLIFARSTGPSP